LEDQFTLGDHCDKDHEWWVEARVQAEPKAVDSSPPREWNPGTY